MKPSTESPLLVHPKSQTGEYVRVTPETAGWEHLSFTARTLSQRPCSARSRAARLYRWEDVIDGYAALCERLAR